MSVSRLKYIEGIGVDRISNAADKLKSGEVLRLENLDTDIPPPHEARMATLSAVTCDQANSYLPFLGHEGLREAVCQRMQDTTGVPYRWQDQCVISAGGLSGVLNVLLALLEPGDEVVVTDPVYIGLVNRIRLAGGIPKFAPLKIENGQWRLDADQFHAALSPKTKVVLSMSPSMPTGFTMNEDEWQVVCQSVRKTNAWLVHDAAMERILFDGLEVIHPARFEGMAERTITIGCVSKEYRMIGWRVGWVVGPEAIMKDVALVSVSNVVCQVGIAMPGAAAALTAKDDGVEAAVQEWQQRRDLLCQELKDLPVVCPQGGWSLLLDCKTLDLEPEDASQLLLTKGGIAATATTGWGSNAIAGRYLRLVYANETIARLRDVRERIRVSWSL
ncbi:Arginine--pyruvate transaminase AruH [Pseudovibrio axinellae]|uniref:aspartate transaminase n=1 Tax=Pseudovibrio axinellae TaxID=989403 RepID=A0A165Z0M6_9HYPH|nr:pyridoxal phosphate-dependent aminotransferase [Pseudovibrio axinellae]KZL19405.1 Arginine--pyruvate transaminase AruH [Pseudovibrio axinellae]SER59033.1 Aspartate/methionine/tyrosine aminotransferase [Pseudovibrio axinellae]